MLILDDANIACSFNAWTDNLSSILVNKYSDLKLFFDAKTH